MYKRIFSLLALASVAIMGKANVTLPSLISDGMVLQQDSKVKLWGWSRACEPIKIVASWAKNDTIKTAGSTDAAWCVELQTPKASQDSYQIEFFGYNYVIVKDIMIGEVILCSGQSNMEYPVIGWSNYPGRDSLIAAAQHSDIRMFTVENRTSDVPQLDFQGSWQQTTPESVKNFSAIGYVLATRLNKELNVPVGIINSSWGGTPVECWIDKQEYDSDSRAAELSKNVKPSPWGPYKPSYIFNAMIAPLTNYKIAAWAWYQGEQNCEFNYDAYAELLQSYAKCMRRNFANSNLPFVFAQIAPYKYGGTGVIVRDQQRIAAGKIDNSALVVIGELGDTADIHPTLKIPAGERFANALLNIAYNKKDALYAGPIFKKAELNKKNVIVSFDNNDGLRTRNGSKSVDSFELAGEDGVFYPAKASIKNGQVVVSCSKVKAPKSIRFAWDDIAMPNLTNKAGVQASCFKATIE